MDLSFLNDDTLSDKLKKHKLDDMKQDYLTKLNTIHIHWKELNEKIIKECKHDYIMEREYTQYGEKWYTCSKCGHLR
jgi:hypothetical protein